MDWERRNMRFCAGVLICAAALRLMAGGALIPVGRALEDPGAVSFLVYLQTGRVVRQMPEPVPESLPGSLPQLRETAPPELPIFQASDAELVKLDDNCGRRPDPAALLTAPVDLHLTDGAPRVLILHTHTTESFTQTDERYQQTSPYRTLDPGHNMIALGRILAQILEEAGIGVIHDTAFHDYPSYNGSYSHAAAATQAHLEQYPTIELVLDLHRDAADTAGGQLVTRCTVDGESAAQLMFVVGTDTRLKHPGWERNLSLALKLQVLLEKENPGLCRDLNLTKNRYNQHLGSYALLVELGAAGNTLDQAKIAARELGEAIVTLVKGTEG